jgi:pimeloyl-ACP methyl ester carboxylesterase
MRPFVLAVAALLVSSSASAQAAPCTAAVAACQRWIPLGTGGARSLAYASHALDAPNTSITRALVMVHGAGRNADHYFETSMAAAFLAGALDNTIVIAPRFAAGRDTVAMREIVWPERGDTWRSGGMAPANATISSFDLMDDIVRTLADKRRFPNLTRIVIAGHSAGGQFATRYGMVSKTHGTPGVAISYVVANPSSYAWPTALRPLPVGDADPIDGYKAALGPRGEDVHAGFTYGPFDSTRAPTFNRWPAGLEGRTGYSAAMPTEQLRRQLAERPFTYLLGQVDVLPLTR